MDRNARKHVKNDTRIAKLLADFKALKKTSIELGNRNVELFEQQNFTDYFHRVGQSDMEKEGNQKEIDKAESKVKKIEAKMEKPSANYPGLSEYEEERLSGFVTKTRVKKKQPLGGPPTAEEIELVKQVAKGDLLNAQNKLRFYQDRGQRWTDADGPEGVRFLETNAETMEPLFYNSMLLAQDFAKKDENLDPAKKETVLKICRRIGDIMGKRNFLMQKEFFLRTLTSEQRNNYEAASQKNKGSSNYLMLQKPDYLREEDIERKRSDYLKHFNTMTMQLIHLRNLLHSSYLDSKLFGEKIIIDDEHLTEMKEEHILPYEKHLLRQMQPAQNDAGAA